MFNPAVVLASAFAEHLADSYRTVYGTAEPDYASVIRAVARLVVERISSSDALYHDAQHTVLVTQVGQAILRGQIIVEEVTPRGLAPLHRRHAVPRHRLFARNLPRRRERALRDRHGGQHDRGPARRLGRLPRTLPYRARQAVRPASLPPHRPSRSRADRRSDRADPVSDSGRRGSPRTATARRPWSVRPI